MANFTVDRYETQGIQRLAGAVLLQAIADLHRGTAANRKSATEWIEGEDCGTMSFQTCCEILNRDPGDVRRMLLTAYGVPRSFLAFFDEARQSQAA